MTVLKRNQSDIVQRENEMRGGGGVEQEKREGDRAREERGDKRRERGIEQEKREGGGHKARREGKEGDRKRDERRG